MGQKVNPLGFRLGVCGDGWSASWYAPKAQYGLIAAEDVAVRNYLASLLNKTELAGLLIERTGETVKVTISSSKPGNVIGKKGVGIEQLRDQLTKKFGKRIEVSVKEVKTPALSAKLIASCIAEEIEKRGNFKKLMKNYGFDVMKAKAKGVKIRLSGRLGGAEIARTEWFRSGSVPLHTLRANIDHALVEAHTLFGIVGVQVWICKGEY